MDVDPDDKTVDLRQHIQDLLNGATDENYSPINVSPLIDRLVPAFFQSSLLTRSSISQKDTWNTGYLAFYQSLSFYTINQYSTFSTAFLEQILSQTMTLLPIATIANYLQFGDNRYDSSYESGDRLLILVGELVSFYGSSAVDSFLHPLFKEQVFGQIHIPQPDRKIALEFENLIKSRGGIIDIYYQQLEVAYPQVQCRWECTITYRFGPKTPLLLHHRAGKNKKQAKQRTLVDIYNYYSRCDTEVVLYSGAWLDDHQHCQPHSNIGKINATMLSIPTENLHEYDDEDYENTSLDERLAKQANPNYIDIPDTYHEDCDGYMNRLTLILLGDNDDTKPDDNIDSPKASPLPNSTQQQQQQQQEEQQGDQQLSSSALSSSRSSANNWIQSASASPKLGAGLVTVDEQNVKRPPVPEKDQLTSTTSSSIGSKIEVKNGLQQKSPINDKITTINNNNNALNVTLSKSNEKQPVIITTATPSSPVPPPPTALTTPGSLHSSEEHLMAKATELMNLFTVKDRCRLSELNENGNDTRRNPNDVIGWLKNLTRKLDDGYYKSSAIHVQLGKATERAHYIVTVRFGTPQMELSIARGHTKKKTAEGLAALAIFGLLEKVSKTINTEMKLPFLE